MPSTVFADVQTRVSRGLIHAMKRSLTAPTQLSQPVNVKRSKCTFDTIHPSQACPAFLLAAFPFHSYRIVAVRAHAAIAHDDPRNADRGDAYHARRSGHIHEPRQRTGHVSSSCRAPLPPSCHTETHARTTLPIAALMTTARQTLHG